MSRSGAGRTSRSFRRRANDYCRITPVMQVYQVKASGRPGQYHYSGNIINVEQDITQLARILPRLPQNANLLLVHREGVTGNPDFRIRRFVVETALSWLKMFNPFLERSERSERSSILSRKLHFTRLTTPTERFYQSS